MMRTILMIMRNLIDVDCDRCGGYEQDVYWS